MADDKRTLLREALRLAQSGKLDKAVEHYRAAVKLDPRDASIHNTLGDLYVRQGRRKEAVEEYLEASALYEKDGFGQRSIAVCQKVVNLDPQHWAVRLRLADLYAAQKLPAEARAQYLLVADHHDKRGDVSQALEIFRKIADLEPDNLAVRLKLAGMFERQKFPEKAAEEYVRAAKGFTERNEPEAAVQHFARAHELSPANLEARVRLAEHHGRRQEWSAVVGLLEAPAAAGDLDIGPLVLYGEAATRSGRPRDAVKTLEQAQEREPNSVPVNLALGRACLAAGELERGALALNRCVSAQLSENRLDEAEALLREMAAAAPDDERILRRVLEVAQKRGEPASVARAYLELAALYEGRGFTDQAAGALEKYLEIMPEDESTARRLSSIREQIPALEAEPPVATEIPAQPRAVGETAGEAGTEIEADAVVEQDLEGEDVAAGTVEEVEDQIVLIDEGEEELELELLDEVSEPRPEPELEAPSVREPGLELQPEPIPEPPTDIEPAIPEEQPALEDVESPGEVDTAPQEPEGMSGGLSPVEPPMAKPPVPEAGPAPEPEAGVLPADLRRELEARAEVPLVPPSKGLGEAGLAEIFNEFQRSVKEQLGDEDFDTHYNLGIAYKEMGLMDEAIAEFALVEKRPERRLEAMSMIALCLSGMGKHDEAARKLRTVIALAADGSAEQKGSLYDLAGLQERTGRAAEALETLQRLAAIDPAYRDVAARLGAAPPPAGAPPRKKSKVSYL
jgi:tetratricopeptide (TPR) repeat protein